MDIDRSGYNIKLAGALKDALSGRGVGDGGAGERNMAETQQSWTESELNSIRKQLDRVLESPVFVQSKRQSRLLSYLVEATLAGSRQDLTQYAIGLNVFDRDPSFDPAVDSLIRVEAGRLRNKLREYYAGPGGRDALVFELPKGGYAIAVCRAIPTTAAPASAADDDASAPRFANDDAGAQEGPAQSGDKKPTLAVLPFQTMSADPEQEYFSDGITDDIITDLSRLSGLFLISRHSSFTYKGSELPVKQISAELGVRYILEGSVRKSRNRVRINAELIDAATDRHIWAERFDRKLEDIFRLQDEVSGKIVNALKISLTGRERSRRGKLGTENVEALEYLWRGLKCYYRFTPEGVDKAEVLFRKALQADSNYAIAHVLLASVLVYRWSLGWDDNYDQTIGRANTLLHSALSMDQDLPAAHAVKGWACLWDRRPEEAVRETQLAVELDPNNADAHLFYSLALSAAKRGEDALRVSEKAMTLNPDYDSFYVFTLGVAHASSGQFDEAIESYKLGIEMNPNFLANYIGLIIANHRLGRTREAAQAVAQARKINPNYTADKPAVTYHPWQSAALRSALRELGIPS